jgi:hypothetical protein
MVQGTTYRDIPGVKLVKMAGFLFCASGWNSHINENFDISTIPKAISTEIFIYQ